MILVLCSALAEKYLREVWPAVTRALKEVGVGCELNLVEGSMTVRTTRKVRQLLWHLTSFSIPMAMAVAMASQPAAMTASSAAAKQLVDSVLGCKTCGHVPTHCGLSTAHAKWLLLGWQQKQQQLLQFVALLPAACNPQQWLLLSVVCCVCRPGTPTSSSRPGI